MEELVHDDLRQMIIYYVTHMMSLSGYGMSKKVIIDSHGYLDIHICTKTNNNIRSRTY